MRPLGSYLLPISLVALCVSAAQPDDYYVMTNNLSPMHSLGEQVAGEWRAVGMADELAVYRMEEREDGTFTLRSRSDRPGLEECFTEYHLRPSLLFPGDFDLLQYANSTSDQAYSFEPPLPEFLKRMKPEDADFLELSTNLRAPPPSEAMVHSPEERRELLRLGAVFLVADERDPIRRILYLDVLLRTGEEEELAARTAEWFANLSAHPNPFFASHLETAATAVRGNAKPKSSELLRLIVHPEVDLQTRMKRLPEVLELEEYIPRPSSLTGYGVPSLFEALFLIRTAGVEATFAAMRGERERAFLLAAGAYRLAQCYQLDPSPIAYYLGLSYREIAARNLELHALNSFETTEELEWAWSIMEKLRVWDEAGAKPAILNAPNAESLLGLHGIDPASFPTEEHVRAQFDLIRAAVAARHRKIVTGDWPRQPEDFAPLMPKGPPPNILFEQQGDEFSIWNNHFEHLAVRLPDKRRYPFPTRGFHPKTTKDADEAFPNGLPIDPFSDKQASPLTVADESPPIIFSQGPNLSPRDAAGLLQLQYDPTNGTVSAGNLYYRKR